MGAINPDRATNQVVRRIASRAEALYYGLLALGAAGSVRVARDPGLAPLGYKMIAPKRVSV